MTELVPWVIDSTLLVFAVLSPAVTVFVVLEVKNAQFICTVPLINGCWFSVWKRDMYNLTVQIDFVTRDINDVPISVTAVDCDGDRIAAII